MSLDDGNVGIGTISPDNPLEVFGADSGIKISSASNNRPHLRLECGTAEKLRLSANTVYGAIGDSSDTNRYMAFKDGNIGIATVTPGVKLHVAGQGLFANNGANIILANSWSSGNTDVLFGGSGVSTGSANNTAARIRCLATAPGGAATGSLTFTVNSGDTFVDALYIKENGNVGIGTVAPAAHLHVSKASGTTTVLTQVAANSTVGFEIKKTGSTTQHWKIVDGQTANGTLEFYDATNSATRMAITGSGSVGLNKTPNSQYNLDIEGQMLLGGHMNLKATNSLQGIGFNRNVHTGAIYSSSYYAYQLHSNVNNFELQRYNGSGTFLGYGLVCTATGNVGINTNAPAARLESYITGGGEKGLRLNSNFSGGNAVDFIPAVVGVSNAGFSIDLAGTTRLVINDGGNVGIGTNSSNAHLKVQSASGTDVLVRINTGGTETDSRLMLGEADAYGMTFEYDGVSNIGYLGMNDNVQPTGSWSKRIQMSRAGTEVAFMAGNVGIGSASPGGKLHVYGGTTAFTNLSDNTDSVQITRNASVHTHQDAKLFIYDNSNADWGQIVRLGGSSSYGLKVDQWVDYGFALFQHTIGQVFAARTSSIVINEDGGNYDFRVEGDTDDYLLFTDGSTDRVAISTTAPAAKLHVEGDFKVGTTNNGNWMGYKDVSLNGNTYTTALTINLNNHTGCYVKLFLSGDWSSHSAVAFVGEYFIQNGSDGYAEPGTVISEFDNTNTDSIESKIVDPSSDTFTIQLKLSTAANGTLGGKLSYHVMGMATAVS